MGRWRVAQSLGLALAVAVGAACSRASSEAARNFRAAAPESDIFQDTNFVRISISIPKQGIKELEQYRWHPGSQKYRPEARATVTEGAKVYTNVALHLKGAAGSFRSIHDRPALTLNFDKFAKGQRFHGLQKLSLNNSVQDPTYLNEKLCREMFAQAGVPVPRSDYAIVTLNGRELGLYVLVEGYNKQFLKRHFKNVGGNLYDGGFLQDVNARLDVNSGDQEDDYTPLRQLAAAAVTARQQGSLQPLAEVLDTERFATMLALEVIQCHWDGYGMNRNNYRVFHDRESGRMIFMPHGLDQMFGLGDRPDIGIPIMPRLSGMVAIAFLGTKEGRELYLRRFGELRANILNVAKIERRLRELEQRIRPALLAFGPVDLSMHGDLVNRLSSNIRARARILDEQLSAPPQPELSFGVDGIAQVAGWRPRAGSGNLRAAKTDDGRNALHIAANGGNGAASWRTRMMLPPGRYRLEALARTSRVRRGGNNGATLRISGTQNNPLISGDTDWTPLAFDFDVHEFNQDVEFVCELKGSSGEAWFDAASLRLRKLN